MRCVHRIEHGPHPCSTAAHRMQQGECVHEKAMCFSRRLTAAEATHRLQMACFAGWHGWVADSLMGGWQPELGSETADCVAGRSFDFTKAKLYTDFSGVQKNGWRLWPLASWVTYQYIPLRLRVLFVNVVAFFWYVFLPLHSCIGCTTASLAPKMARSHDCAVCPETSTGQLSTVDVRCCIFR